MLTNETLEVIGRRRSIRAFRSEQLKDSEIEAIVEAGACAPSGSGHARHFCVVQRASMLERVNHLAKEYAASSGLPWLESLGNDKHFHSLYHAPTVIFVSGGEQDVSSVYDVSAATENLLLAAESLGIGSCWGYFATQAFLTREGAAMQAELSIPDGYRVYTSVMLGYKDGEAPAAPERKGGQVTIIK